MIENGITGRMKIEDVNRNDKYMYLYIILGMINLISDVFQYYPTNTTIKKKYIAYIKKIILKDDPNDFCISFGERNLKTDEQLENSINNYKEWYLNDKINQLEVTNSFININKAYHKIANESEDSLRDVSDNVLSFFENFDNE